ncbi:MAG: DUF1080 domain-containing protein [Bacteroidetes bacterium]|nr:MAG: DUF1080 domain-containing protein [Bacteroidota bacterium]
MKKVILSMFFVSSLFSFAQNDNKLSKIEKKEGWKLLFDGKTSKGWKLMFKNEFPSEVWKVQNGELVVTKGDGGESTKGGDIVTIKKYNNFELTLEAKLTEGANSGVKYFVDPMQPKLDAGTSVKGLEFQLLDDDKHPDAKKGKDGNRTIGSLYDLIPADSTKKPAQIGSWNKVRIVSLDNKIEHWLNGQKVVEYIRKSDKFKELIAQSKYKDIPNFGMCEEGYILLQDHGDEVHFKNIKIRELSKK